MGFFSIWFLVEKKKKIRKKNFLFEISKKKKFLEKNLKISKIFFARIFKHPKISSEILPCPKISREFLHVRKFRPKFYTKKSSTRNFVTYFCYLDHYDVTESQIRLTNWRFSWNSTVHVKADSRGSLLLRHCTDMFSTTY